VIESELLLLQPAEDEEPLVSLVGSQLAQYLAKQTNRKQVKGELELMKCNIMIKYEGISHIMLQY